jgi:hypothetical protein
MKSLLLGVLCSFVALAAEQPVKRLSTEAIPARGSTVPLFRHGYLVLFPGGAFNGVRASAIFYGFTAYGSNGQFVYQKILQLPGAHDPVVKDVDFDSDGNAAVAVSAQTGDSGLLHGILLVDRNGADAGFIDTRRYVPGRIAIAPDRTIWTLGWQRDAQSNRVDKQDYMTVRQFSTDGKQLNAYLPRSTFPPGLEPGAEAPGVSIRASNDCIGILANSGDSSVKQEWVELDLAGNMTERARVEGALRATHLAVFTADGHVYLAGNPSSQVYTLDHATHTWKLIPKQGAGDLMGADGDSVVYEVYSQPYPSPIQLEWYRRP